MVQPAGTPEQPRNGPLGSEGPQGSGQASQTGEAGLALLYLRPLWPGGQNRPQAVLTNVWIGSRSKPALGRLSVQDLVGLNKGAQHHGSAGRDGRDGRNGRDGPEGRESTRGAA